MPDCLDLDDMASKIDAEHERSKRDSREPLRNRVPTRASSVQYPDRLREGGDVHEDVTAANGTSAQYLNQSVFSMIAAAGSKTDFHARFDEGSSDSDEGLGDYGIDEQKGKNWKFPTNTDKQTTETHRIVSDKSEYEDVVAWDGKRQRSLPRLDLSTVREKNSMSRSTILPPRDDLPKSALIAESSIPKDAQVMSRVQGAQAVPAMSGMSPETQKVDNLVPEGEEHERSPTSLVLRLKEIFGFEDEEDLISGAAVLIKPS